MGKIQLRYQITLFSDFSGLEASPESYNMFEQVNTFGTLRPLPFVEHNISEEGAKNIQRVKMTSEDGAFTVEFRFDRVIFSMLNIDVDNFVMPSIGVFANNVIDFITQADVFSAIHFSRIGYVRYSLFDSPSPDEIYSKFNSPILFQKDLQKGDWTNYLPTRYTSSNGTTFNVVTTLKHTVGPMKIKGVIRNYDGVFVSVDVNTPNTIVNKYYEDEIKKCIDTLRGIESKVNSQICNLIENTDAE